MLILSIIYIAVSALSLIVCVVFMPPSLLMLTIGIILVLNIVSIVIKKNKKAALVANIVLGVLTLFALLGGLAVINTYL